MNVSLSERITSYFGQFTILSCLIIASVVFVIAIIILIISEKQRAKSQMAHKLAQYTQQHQLQLESENFDITSSKHIEHDEYESYLKIAKKRVPTTIISILTSICMIFSMLSIYALLDTYHIAYTHGYRGKLTENASGLWKTIHESPVEDKLPADIADLNQRLILYYRFGCPDCGATFKDISARVENLDGVYWVATRSDQGIKLRETYPVDEVPSAVYIRKDGTTLTYVLYYSTSEGPQLDKNNLDDLMTGLAYDRSH